MFVGRERETSALEESYNSQKFEFFTIRGRRRVGKTTLLQEFCKNKETIYFVAQEQSRKANLEKFSKAVVNYFGFDEKVTYKSFEDLIEAVFEASKNKRIVLVVDEFPYLANSDKGLMSVLQNLIDKYKKDSKLFLILCGSSISFMENKVVAYKAPLYGRATGQLKIEPFFFKTAKRYFENYSNEEQIIAYSVFGGIPAYLETINNTKSLKENIINSFLKPQSYLFEEPTTFFKEEFREPAIYNSIVEAIANGSIKVNDIATKIGHTTSKTSIYLKNLLELQIIKRETPITEKNSNKKTIYKLCDNLFAFWYKFVSPNLSTIGFADAETLYKSLIEPYLNEYVGKIFEEICKEYLLLNINSKNIPFFFHQIGTWWGNNSKTKSEEEIDILTFTNDKINALFAECKWRNEKTNKEIVEDLKRKSKILKQFKNKYYAIFSKSGFKKDLLEIAEQENNIYLFDLNKMCGN